jgi:hypothetical protein
MSKSKIIVDYNKVMTYDIELGRRVINPTFKEWLDENNIPLNSFRARIHIPADHVYSYSDNIFVQRFNYLYELDTTLFYDFIEFEIEDPKIAILVKLTWC